VHHAIDEELERDLRCIRHVPSVSKDVGTQRRIVELEKQRATDLR